MDDSAAKVKQLSDSLQGQQTKIAKKKEEVEGLNKSLSTLDKEIYELRQVVAEMEGLKELRKDSIVKAKEEIKSKIEQVKKILNSDKQALTVEKEELQAKAARLQTELKTVHDQKNDLLKTNKGESPKKEEVKQDEESKREEEESNEPLEVLVKKVTVEKEATGFLKVNTIVGIVDVCVNLAGRKFKETVQENKKKLRAIKNLDLKTFLDETKKDLSHHTEIYQEIEKKVLEGLGLEKNELDKSIEYYMSIGNMEVVALMNLLGEKLKSFLKSTKEINRDTFRDILQYKNEFIEKEGEAIFGEDNRRIVVQTQFATVSGTYAQKEQMSVNVLRGYFEFRVSNAIYEKFGVEDEDIRNATLNPEIQYDTEIAELMLKGEELVYKCLPQAAAPAEHPENK